MIAGCSIQMIFLSGTVIHGADGMFLEVEGAGAVDIVRTFRRGVGLRTVNREARRETWDGAR
jgi:hypothetical protein